MISYFGAITKGLLVEWKLKVLSWLDVDLCIGNISLVAHREKLTRKLVMMEINGAWIHTIS